MTVGALFLDRDGVVNVDRNYVHRVEDFIFIDGIFDTARRAVAHGFRLIIVTNQAGIARGLYTEADFAALTAWMCRRFAAQGVTISGVYHCPYHAEGLGRWRIADHPDRKPNPGMLLRALDDHGLEAQYSLLIGDQESDIEAGRRAGLFGVARFARGLSPAATAADRVLASHVEAVVWLDSMAQRLQVVDRDRLLVSADRD